MDVFSRTMDFGGAVTAESTRMTFADLTVGLILQDVNITYEQTISRMFALESGKIYFVAGQTNGGFGATHIVGPAGIQTAFYQAYGNVCNIGGAFTIQANAGCGSKVAKSSVTLTNPVISQVNIQAKASDMIIYSGFNATFTEMQFK